MELSSSIRLFRRTKALEGDIDAFLDKLSESTLVFKHALATYFREGASDAFEERLKHVNALESQADRLRRDIEQELYLHTLIPESRGDVLGLIENLDSIINLLEGTLWSFSIEKPEIPEPYHADYLALAEMSSLAVEHVVMASRSFFTKVEDVSNHTHKVMFYEKETDKISTNLKRAIFESSLDLAHKAHLRNFVEHIDNAADSAEDVADRLAIYVIKRTV